MYSIDTSALIDGWVRYYPPDVLPPLWELLDELIRQGTLRASKEVLVELQRQDDDLFNWCNERPDIFVEIDDQTQDRVLAIMAKYLKLVDTRTGRSGADPFVIALAQTRNPPMTVVTGEGGGSLKRPTIPFVCQQERIPCIKLLDLIRQQGWAFSR